VAEGQIGKLEERGCPSLEAVTARLIKSMRAGVCNCQRFEGSCNLSFHINLAVSYGTSQHADRSILIDVAVISAVSVFYPVAGQCRIIEHGIYVFPQNVGTLVT
jgi:hypothetical protein